MEKLMFVLFVSSMYIETKPWKYDRKPKVFGEKISMKTILPRYRRVQERIIELHNRVRAQVQPTAADMLAMKWDRSAAKSAQKWAEGCRLLDNSPVAQRWHDQLGACGQNIFISTHRVPWLLALKSWYQERDNFIFGGHNVSIKDHGRYLQTVWASTHKVGCGLAHCIHSSGKPYFNYVCNYCPMGNDPGRISRPYRRGKPCASCPGHCRVKLGTCLTSSEEEEDCQKSDCLAAGLKCVGGSCRERKCSTGRLCTNACHTVDLWANCAEMADSWETWLCHSPGHVGRQRRESCNATCTCQGLIH